MSIQTLLGMKVNIGADSSQFRKGVSEAEQGMKTFKQEAGNAFDSFAAAFGVNMGKLRESISSFKASLLGIGKAATTSATGAGVLTKALQFLKVALLSTGIGAIVVALGTLLSYFTKTERGADKLAKVMAGFKAVFDVLIDRLSAFGEGVYLIFTGQFKQGFESLKASMQGIGKEMLTEGKQAAALEEALDNLYDKETALAEVQAKRNLEVAKLRQQSENQALSEAERAEMLRKAMELEKKTLEENLEIQRERARVVTEQVGLGESMAEDERRAAEERAKLAQMEADMINTTRRMYTREQSLSAAAAKEVTDATKEQAKSYRELREEADRLFDSELKMRESLLSPIQQQRSSAEPQAAGLAGMSILSDDEIAAFQTQLLEMQGVVIDITSEINSAFNDMAVGFGEAIGMMISGAGGFQNFGAIILGPLADMAIQVGKIAIGAGIAIEGIKKAFQSMNPGAAIAAGIALVALGSAIKGALSNAARGGGNTNSYNVVPGYDGRGLQTSGNAYGSTQAVKVEVVGETSIKNKDIYIAFKNAENQRRLNT